MVLWAKEEHIDRVKVSLGYQKILNRSRSSWKEVKKVKQRSSSKLLPDWGRRYRFVKMKQCHYRNSRAGPESTQDQEE